MPGRAMRAAHRAAPGRLDLSASIADASALGEGCALRLPRLEGVWWLGACCSLDGATPFSRSSPARALHAGVLPAVFET